MCGNLITKPIRYNCFRQTALFARDISKRLGNFIFFKGLSALPDQVVDSKLRNFDGLHMVVSFLKLVYIYSF